MDLKKGPSWSAVRYMIGEIQYGGRVTDDYDKHLLNTYAKLWFGEHMFQQNFRFCNCKVFPIPVFKTVEDYISYIDSLPMVITPEVFGMHPNADIT
ncbi:PREDICTED: dynein heavy chain 5, axonemal-like [Amphimedon queenslandica]|uniref:Dynein heavy chain AAA lid domain-containing protein n=1 Tax=Amphimedon queenslandica TaxID=400682 RepID=A0A1X7T4C3_AMPQE|nr:PREDICTED: dynein heavy chain 5, axonemal-like [Amphimedon queenslandica]|eukprot:XP_019861450.1 PREDICTED: dynein heavy chain 5, axonemal-like [Amphimedon queenslandica]